MRIHLGGTQYKQFSYPAHEIQVRLTGETELSVKAQRGPIEIVARDLTPASIIELALLKDAISAVAGTTHPVNLLIPYLPYARADRRFVPGDCHGLLVMARLLFAMSFTKIVTLDVHSSVAMGIVPELVNISPEPLISQAINWFCKQQNAHVVNVLYPDDGASKRYKLAPLYGCNVFAIEASFLSCYKKRDAATGAMLGFEVPDVGEFQDGPILIVDDICDGGATFLGIAQALRAKGVTSRMGLYVTHGIFSKGILALHEYFDAIFTSDSLTHSLALFGRMGCLGLLK